MIKEIFNKFIECVGNNKGKFFGGLLGFIIAILVLIIGFSKTFFIAFCTWVGFFLGSKSDNEETLKELFGKILSPIKRNFR